MENVIKRHWNLAILAMVLFAQLMALAYQVRRPAQQGSTRLIRVWAVSMITPFEKAVVHSADWASGVWRNYIDLHDVRHQNEALREEIQHLRLQEVRLTEDANQARRLQSLLGFKEQYINGTMAAQVISSTGSEFTRGIYIDKGSRDGIKRDMPVITASGVVGKVYTVFPSSSLVLEINDPTSGAGVILEKSRLQGILKGDPGGGTVVNNVMADEKITTGDRVLTSGGDRVYPKGLPVGTVEKVLPGEDTFLKIRVKPAADLDRLEEVLVITKVEEQTPQVDEANGPIRAADILARRLPTVEPTKDANPNAEPPSMAQFEAQQRAARKAAAEQGKQPTGVNAVPALPARSDQQSSKTPAAGVQKAKLPDKPAANATKPAANSTKEPPQ
jgi:rod shape-determining protein MreC